MKRKYKLMVGNLAEQIVCDKLRKDGYRILTRNFLTRQGEIDVIAFKNQTIHFIEVKSLREGHAPFHPEESVTFRKMKTILSVARSYLQMLDTVKDIDTDYITYRFDVAAIVYDISPYRIISFDYFEDYYRIDPLAVEREIYKK